MDTTDRYQMIPIWILATTAMALGTLLVLWLNAIKDAQRRHGQEPRLEAWYHWYHWWR
jgi:hypothetical protein